MTDKTAVERIKELDEERAALFEQAKQEALRRATQAIEDLNALGLAYRLVAPPAEKVPAGSKSPQEAGPANKKRGTRP
jgi:predicted deacetylase